MTYFDATSGTMVFEWAFPGPGPVSVVGAFNQWNQSAHPMRPVGGRWRTAITLREGIYQYGFAVRGMVFSDRESAHTDHRMGWPWSCAVCRAMCGLGTVHAQVSDKFLQNTEGATSVSTLYR